MTALAVRPSGRRTPPPVAGWEWHECSDDGWAHLYFGVQLRGDNSARDPLVRPWCETLQRFPLDHARQSVSESKVIPKPGRTCPGCASQNEHRRVELPCPQQRRSGSRP
ncbi:hypothetical protein DMA12_45655 [Amycolatopsis balhimycina DSM 5908]|uniref:Uncharacterized protein n=1 Tax=Amycolatopsis balhimycina DSM 5908 TaxID=1081091 RepID=A0A428VWB2_AMYBA|nr:hypothetical protein DMA12_45655 [Amycolatopsis balhimycina DSM 5908]